MNKLILVLALCLGLGVGLFWPLEQTAPAIPAQEDTPSTTPPVEQTPDKDSPPANNPQTIREESAENQTQTPAPPAAAQPKPAPAPEAKAPPKPRVVAGQTPEEVIKSFRPSQPLGRLISRSKPPRTINTAKAKAPKTRPNIKTPKVAKPKPEAAPVNGNYCYLVYGYEDWPTDVAFAVCMGESSGKPRAINRADKHKTCRGSYGLFQIACFWADPQAMLDPHKNIQRPIGSTKRAAGSPGGLTPTVATAATCRHLRSAAAKASASDGGQAGLLRPGSS